MRKPKVVWWIDHLGHGGSQKSLIEIIRGLEVNLSAQAVVVFNSNIDSIHLLQLKKAGVSVRVIGKWRMLLGVGLLETWWWLRKEEFDIAATFLFYSDVVGTLLSRFARIQFLISCQRSTNKHYNIWQRLTLSKVLAAVNTVVVNSPSIRFDIGRYVPRNSQVKVIPTGIKLNHNSIVYDGFNLRQVLSVPSNTMLIGSVGRLSKEKGLDTLVEVIPLLITTKAHLVIVGSGPCKKELEDQIERLGITRRVHMMGYRKDARAILSQLNVYVQLSRFEGLPVTLLEAVAEDCPIVTTGVGGISDLIVDDRHGWKVELKDSMQIASAIDEALQGNKSTLAKVKTAKAKLIEDFSYQDMIERWSCLLTSLD